MYIEQNVESAEIWRGAQRRRTEDIAKWLSHFLKRSEKMPGAEIARNPLKPRLTLAHASAIAVIAFAAVTSVSAVVHQKNTPHVVQRPVGPMAAVNGR
jgi:hypothetical protein